MEIQNTPSQELSIIPFDKNILPQNADLISTLDHNDCSSTALCTSTSDEETGDTSSCQLLESTTSPGRRYGFSNLLQGICTTEEFLSAIFTWVMAGTSFIHLALGLELLAKTSLSNSFSPKVMSLIKYCLATMASSSLVWAEVYYCNPYKILAVGKGRYSFVQSLSTSFSNGLAIIRYQYSSVHYTAGYISFMVCLGGFTGLGKPGWLTKLGLYTLIYIMATPTIGRVPSSSELLVAIVILTTLLRLVSSHLHLLTSLSAPSFLCFLDKGVKKLLPVAVARVSHFSNILKEKKIGKLIKFAVGLVGTVLFQNFFRITTFDEVRAFLYLATSCLATLTLINASQDFGILNFLLGNTILGSTVSQSGLGSKTWFTCGICLLLYILRLNLKSMTASQNIETMRRPPFFFWIFYFCIVFESIHSQVYKT